MTATVRDHGDDVARFRAELDQVWALLADLELERQRALLRASRLLREARGIVGVSEMACWLDLSRPTR